MNLKFAFCIWWCEVMHILLFLCAYFPFFNVNYTWFLVLVSFFVLLLHIVLWLYFDSKMNWFTDRFNDSWQHLLSKCQVYCTMWSFSIVLLYDFFLCAGPYVLVCSSYLLLLQHIWIWNKGMLIKFHIILISAF